MHIYISYTCRRFFTTEKKENTNHHKPVIYSCAKKRKETYVLHMRGIFGYVTFMISHVVAYACL